MDIKYKDSGIDWINRIPVSWEVSRMKFLASYINGFAFKPEDWSSEGLPIIRIQDLSGSNDSPNYYEGVIDNKYLVHKGDILISWAATLDAFVWEKEDGWLNQHIFKAEIYPNTNKRYFYWLAKIAMLNMNNDNKHGIFMQHVTTGIFNNFCVPLPPLPEQQIIANFLDEKCGEIDSLIGLQQKMIDKLKSYKQSIISEAVTRGLNTTAMKESGIDWVKTMPTHWNVVTPKALFSLRKDKAKDGERQLTASQQYGVIYQDEYMQLTGSKIVTVMKDFDILKHVESGDFVISMRSFQGGLEYSENTGSISSAYVMLIPNPKYVYPKFYRWLFKSSFYINALQSTSNMVRDGQAMRYSNFVQVPLYVVPLSEQEEIASYLDEKCAYIDRLIDLKQQKIEKLKSYKKSIIYEAVTGKLDLCN